MIHGSRGHDTVRLKLILRCMLPIPEFKERQKIKKNKLTNKLLFVVGSFDFFQF